MFCTAHHQPRRQTAAAIPTRNTDARVRTAPAKPRHMFTDWASI
ncbi:hypothetical protein [Nioella nitratireducens]|nr:hypothetical protein [Nioella nitratireducens]